MDLHGIGYCEWFAHQAKDLLQPGRTVARVVAVDRGAYRVRTELQESSAELSGRFQFTATGSADFPCVGDWVCVEQASPDLAIVHAVLPRQTFLRRKSAGKAVDFQMLAANLDVALIVQSCQYDFNLRRLDRYLVVAREGRIEPVIVLSKQDLVTPEELAGLTADIRNAGIAEPIFPISNQTEAGLDRLREIFLPGKTFCLLGSSGVGKTTLINRLIGRDALETKEVSGTGEGVHTTSRRQLLLLSNGAMLIDTPGMRELGLLGAGEGLRESFSEIEDRGLACRFADCTHTTEPGCAVLKALESGELSAERYESYHKLSKENVYHDLSYQDKRKKDKNFGRFIKSYKKTSRKR